MNTGTLVVLECDDLSLHSKRKSMDKIDIADFKIINEIYSADVVVYVNRKGKTKVIKDRLGISSLIEGII